MSNLVLLESKNLGSLKINEHVDNVPSYHTRNSYVIVTELQRLSATFPTFFIKNPDTGQFSLVCLFGFDKGENLFLEKGQWATQYIPLNMRRFPFALGSHKKDDGKAESVVLVDLDDPRVSEHEGEVLFNERGFPSTFLEDNMSILKTLEDGQSSTYSFIQTLLELDLVIPANFQITFDNGETQKIEGLYTVNQNILNSLDDKTVVEFHRNNYFEYIYMMIASIGQMKTLIDKKNQVMKV